MLNSNVVPLRGCACACVGVCVCVRGCHSSLSSFSRSFEIKSQPQNVDETFLENESLKGFERKGENVGEGERDSLRKLSLIFLDRTRGGTSLGPGSRPWVEF